MAGVAQPRRFGTKPPLLGAISLGIALGLVPQPLVAQESYATYYTVTSCQQDGNLGTITASGEPYNETGMTVALPHRRFGGRYQVCHASRCVQVRHNDYGPGKAARLRGVVADLTPAAYDALGCPRGINQRGIAWGTCQVSLQPVSR